MELQNVEMCLQAFAATEGFTHPQVEFLFSFNFAHRIKWIKTKEISFHLGN